MLGTWKSIIETSGVSVVGLLAQVVVLTITARWLGPEGRGVLVAANSWVIVFGTVGSLSLGQIIIHQTTGKNREEWLPAVLGTLVGLMVIAGAAGWIFSGLSFWLSEGSLYNHLAPPIFIAAFLPLPFILLLDGTKHILLALDKLRIYNLTQLAGHGISILTLILFVMLLGWGTIGAVWSFTFWQTSIVVMIVVYLARRTSYIRLDWGLAKKLMVNGAKLHINALGSLAITYLTVLIINHYRPPAETAFFQLAQQLILVVNILPTSVSMVTYTLVSRKGPDRAWPEQRKLLVQTLLLVALIGLAGYYLSPQAVRLLAGEEFLPAVRIFRILLFSTAGMAFAAVMASQWIGRGMFWHVSLITLGIGSLNLLASYLVIPKYGMVGAAWISVVVYLVAVLVNSIFALWIERNYNQRSHQLGSTSDHLFPTSSPF